MKNRIKQLFFGSNKPDLILIIQKGTTVTSTKNGQIIVIQTEVEPLKIIYSKDYLTNK